MYILLVVLIVNGQFNSFTDIKFQEFSTKSDCETGKTELREMFSDAVGKLKLKCIKK